MAPRCRLINPGAEQSQGFGCSPIKVVRERSERRETVRSLSAMRVEELRGVDLVREDRVEHTTGGPVVAPAAVPGS